MRIIGTTVDYEPAQIGTSCLICDGFIALYYPLEPAIPRICTKCKDRLKKILYPEKDVVESEEKDG